MGKMVRENICIAIFIFPIDEGKKAYIKLDGSILFS